MLGQEGSRTLFLRFAISYITVMLLDQPKKIKGDLLEINNEERWFFDSKYFKNYLHLSLQILKKNLNLNFDILPLF